MCGIAGLVTRDGTPPDEGLLRRLSQAIAHRGPDADGLWMGQGVGLVHRRLSIIDLSPEGNQPMWDVARRWVIVFNGEIYNYRELRIELEALGSRFRTQTDTEVVLEAYQRWGKESLLKFRGMFAFALWDAHEQRLVLARDRIGKKPLFYHQVSDGGLVFGSEIKALSPVVSLQPDWQAVRLFLGLQYVPSPRTGFQDVCQLEPGTFAVWKDGVLKVERYHRWNTDVQTAESRPEIDAHIRQLLEESVKIRQLASDVPVGAFLSGGVDSAAVTAFASRQVKNFQTFTMGFPEGAMDERKEAREVAQFFHTDHHEFEARPEHLLECVDELVGQYDAPYADSSALPLWLLARETAKHIKVVLTGDGGDELFGGYRRYVAYEQALLLGHLPGGTSVVPIVCDAIARLGRDPRFARMSSVLRALRVSPQHAYAENFCGSYFSSQGIQDLCTPEFLNQTRVSDAVDFVRSGVGASLAPLRDAMFFDLISYLPDDLNVKMDRATMRFGLEARSPFLDQELVSYALTLPLKEKVYHGKTKIALKRALLGLVPDDVLKRPKRGFQVPLAQWFRGPLRATLRERCLDPNSALTTIIKRESIERLCHENDRGADHGNRLWMLLMLSTWLKHISKV